MIYLDNAATTFPKPASVYDEMDRVNRSLAVNAGRGSYNAANAASAMAGAVFRPLGSNRIVPDTPFCCKAAAT